jgi:hypothetical protein
MASGFPFWAGCVVAGTWKFWGGGGAGAGVTSSVILLWRVVTAVSGGLASGAASTFCLFRPTPDPLGFRVLVSFTAAVSVVLVESFSFRRLGFRVGGGAAVAALWLVLLVDFVAEAGGFTPPGRSFRETAPPEVSTAIVVSESLFGCWSFGLGDGDGAASVSDTTGGDESSGDELYTPAPPPPAPPT